jgi:putative heme iron utilization protein
MTGDASDNDPARISRGLLRSRDRAVLSTALAGNGWPYGSLVMTACDHSAAPLLLISELAEHTKNVASDSRASLLFDDTGDLDNPLTGARVTVLGRLEKCDDDSMAARYVARHPDAEIYFGFADFALYRMTVERAHIVAGFGAIHWIDAADLLFDTDGFDSLAAAESDIVSHMNEDHADAVHLYATVLAGLGDGDWSMTGVDPEGIDLRNGGITARLAFDKPVGDAESARRALVEMVKKARAENGG